MQFCYSVSRLCLLLPAALAVHSVGTAQTTEAAAAAAKPAPKPDAGVVQVEVKGEAASYDARKYDTAAKVVVTYQELIKYGDTSVAEALKRQAGITVARGEIRMRGLGNGYTQVLVDGSPMAPGFALDSLSPELVERVEILRAATADLSAQAIAGTVNIVLKRSLKVEQKELKLTVSGNNAFTSTRLNFAFGGKFDTLSYVFSGYLAGGTFDQPMLSIDEGFDGAGVPTYLRTNTGNAKGKGQSLVLTPRLNWKLDAANTLSSQTMVNLGKYDRVTRKTWSGAAQHLPLLVSETAETGNNDHLFRSDLNWVRKTGGTKLDSKLTVNLAERNTDQLQYGYGSNAALLRLAPGDAHQVDQSAVLVSKYSFPVGEGHTMLAGIDTSVAKSREERVQHDDISLGFIPYHIDENNHARVQRFAAFIQDDWVINPRWSVYGGLRWEGIKTDATGNAFAPLHSSSSVWSPLAQVLWKVGPSDQFRLALSRTYKAPQLESLLPRYNVSINNTPTMPDSRGNPALKPELAWGIDAAYEHIVDNGITLTTSVFARQVEDVITRDIALMGGRWVSMPVNRGKADVAGVEAEAKIPLKLYSKHLTGVDLRFSLAGNWSSVDSIPGPDNRLADQVPYNATLGLDYRASAALSAGGSFSLKGGGWIRLSPTQETYVRPTRDLDLYALWKFDPKTQLRVSAVNVLGQDFASEARYATAAGGTRTRVVEEVTTMLRAVLEVKF